MKQSYSGRPAAQRLAFLKDSRPLLRRAGAALLLGLAPAAQAQQRPAQNFFQSDGAARTAAATSPLAATLVRSQALTLDEPGLRAALATAPPESRAGAAPLVLALPQPDGPLARFALREAPVMEAPLAARFPQIRTYAGVGLDDATATVRLDLTPQGFHAQVLSSAAPGFDIDPARPTDTRHCLSYYRKDVRAAASQMAQCGVVTTPAEEQASVARVAAWRARGGAAAARSTGAQLRVYRLALTCTPEYSLTKGNTTASVLAALVVSLNRTVGIFERELTMRLVLVANNDRLVFLSGTGPQPVPTLTDNNKYSLLGENQTNTDRIIGTANYDLGHLINSGGGGVARTPALCNPVYKAQGVSGDDIGTIAHEMGHQFGAQHTFSSSSPGNNSTDAAWEPGAGVTIMSYGGGSGPNDVQPYRERLYHTGSYAQAQATMDGAVCGTSVATGNSAPVVSVPASGKTLPAGTPFRLTATATDAENDPLTYSWEQLDLGPIGDLNMPQVTGETPPLFRFWLPTTSPTRYFPRLAELVKNTAPLGERLPTVTRGLKFRCTARDLHNGPAGLIGGVGLSALVSLDVSAAAGPFVVSAPNAAGISWAGGSTQTVSWNVANTNTAPVSCAKVNLRLSLDGGLTYPLTLATGINNSGTASVTVPNVASTTATARLMVEAADNYFFDISNNNFAITPTVLPPAAGVLITGIVPASAITGATIRLTGTGLSGATRVSFTGNGDNTASSGFTVNAAGTELSGLKVPVGALTGVLTVTTPAGTSAASSQVFTLCTKPAALAQNARLTLSAAGTAMLAPTAVNSGSGANCGVAAASTLSVVPNRFTTADLGPVVVASSLRLNGNSQYVAIGRTVPMPEDNSPYTIEAWVKPTAAGDNGIIGWGSYNEPNSCNALRLTSTGLMNYWWNNDLESPTGNLVGAWHHVAATCDGTTRTLYLDGKAIGSDRPIYPHTASDAQAPRIGSTNSGEYFSGLIDEVRVWSVARTAAQLSTARGAHLLGSPAGLVAYYRFGEGSGTTTATTAATAANVGTLTGGASWSTDAPTIVNGVPVVLTVTDASGQTGTAPAVVTVLPAVATATAAANATAFSVWPNPVGARSTLHVRLVGPASAARASLRNGLGQLVRTRTFGGSATELSTAGLASGLYLLSVQADGQAPAVRRVVVE